MILRDWTDFSNGVMRKEQVKCICSALLLTVKYWINSLVIYHYSGFLKT